MPLTSTTPEEFIEQTFAPMIAVITSAEVENSCKKNNLSFIEMMQPFLKTYIEGLPKDLHNSSSTSNRNLRISFRDIHSRPPPPHIAQSYFNQAISSNTQDKTKEVVIGDCKIEIPVSVPWFEAWRHVFFEVLTPCDHEFVKHYVGYLLVASTDDSEPLELFEEMNNQALKQISNENTKWFTPSSFILSNYLLLHDNSKTDMSKGFDVYEKMKNVYGEEKSFLLKINSQNVDEYSQNLPDPWVQFLSTNVDFKVYNKKDDVEQGVEATVTTTATPTTPVMEHPLSPDIEENYFPDGHIRNNALMQHGMCLSAEDITGIKQFVHEYCTKALVPHFDIQIQQVNDQVVNKKGVSRSIFSATKRWFGTNKPGAPGATISPAAIAYSSDSHELLLRKLGDLHFLIGNYNQAFNAYHSAKRDFNADGAWMHYAGTLEMAALSAFMTNSPALAKKVVDYFEESITTYQQACRMETLAIKSTLLSAECLQGREQYGEAAKQLIRMTKEDSHARSAMLLEQAAYCFLNSKKPTMHRKYAFHMVLAGHRFSKASHKNHTMRCYHQAYQVYANKNWSVAEDHIIYTIGRHASQLKLMSIALTCFTLLVTRARPQSNQQLQSYLKDYIANFKSILSDGMEAELAVPIIENHLTQIHTSFSNRINKQGIVMATGIQLSSRNEKEIWLKLEERIVSYANGNNLMVFNPLLEVITHKTKHTVSPTVFIGETVAIFICLRNPLNIPIKITNIRLTLSVKYPGGNLFKEVSQENSPTLCSSIEEFILQSEIRNYMLLHLKPCKVCTLRISGISYNLHDVTNNSVSGKQHILTLEKDDKDIVDNRLILSVQEEAPLLQVSFQGLRSEMIENEITKITLNLQNIGKKSIARILLTSSSNFVVGLADSNEDALHNVDAVLEIPLAKILESNESIEINILIKPRFCSCVQNLELLFYYEHNNKERYRLVRHLWPVKVEGAIKVSVDLNKSESLWSNNLMNFQTKVNFQYSDDRDVRCYIESIAILSSSWKLKECILEKGGFLKNGQQMHFLIKVQYCSSGLKISKSCIACNKSSIPYIYFLPNSGQKDIETVLIINWKVVGYDDPAYEAMGQETLVFKEPLNQILHTKHVSKEIESIKWSKVSESKKSQEKLDDTMLTRHFVDHPRKISHSFADNSFCTVPVNVVLCNQSKTKLIAKLETTDKLQVTWMGQTQIIVDLEPLAELEVKLTALICSPGAFDIGASIIISAKVSDNYQVQSYKASSVVIVH